MKIRFRGQEADSLFRTAREILKARDDLPDIRASGKRGAPVVRRTPEDDPGVVKLIDSLGDEPIQQRCGGHTLAGSARREASPGGIANPERRACGHGVLPCPQKSIPQCSARELQRPIGKLPRPSGSEDGPGTGSLPAMERLVSEPGPAGTSRSARWPLLPRGYRASAGRRGAAPRPPAGASSPSVRAAGRSCRGCRRRPSRGTPGPRARADTPRRPGGAGAPRRPGGRARSAEPGWTPG